MKKVFLIVLILLSITGCNKEPKKEKQITENNGMLSFTIDGEKTDIKPTKEDGYIVNKIICDNGSDMMWDNDNWEVELTKINSNGRCKVDFTKDTNAAGYRVTITSNMASALDSLSKATTLNGTVKIYSKSKIENVTGCNGIIEDNKVIVSNIASNQTCNITIEDKTLAGILKIAYPPQPGRTDFSVIDNGTPALYIGTDDQGTTYYFSGDGTNMKNWVKFADKYWRIIRINGNGSVRLLYAGSGGTDGYVRNPQYYATSDGQYNHPAYVGWKYTKAGTLAGDRVNETKSYVYSTVESWYNSNISPSYGNYIDTTAIYCNDRELASGSSYSTSSNFNYAAYTRLITNKAPVFTCGSTSDRFNTFGLMTADEVVYAGGVYGKNSPKAYYYLNASGGSSTGSYWWWTMSPYYCLSGYAFVFYVRGSDNPSILNAYNVSNSGVVRPVISLKKEVIVTSGDGSSNSPYKVILP